MRIITLLTVAATLAAQPAHRTVEFEQQPAVVIANDKIELTINLQGGAFVNLTLADDPEKLSPLWNPARFARELGQTNRPGRGGGSVGHFVCVDGFGSGSNEERAAGLPGHGEAHTTQWEIKQSGAGAITFQTHLPVVQEIFTRTVRMNPGENVIYVDSTLQSELGFDRPISWAEHTTLGSPFLSSGVTVSNVSGTRAQNRPYTGTGNPGAARRLVSGANFTWPLAPGLDGKNIDLTAPPESAHYLDHAVVLVDPSLKLGWIATVNTAKHLVIGYVFKRDEYPWVQNWGNFPENGKFARGLEFSTQPYDESRREAVAKNGMFDAPTFRWLPAKATIRSSFLLFYAHTPDGFGKVETLRFENGQIMMEDGSKKRITLAASRPL